MRALNATMLVCALGALASSPAYAVYSCGGETDDCQCGASNAYPCCDNGGNCTWWAWEMACCNWGIALPGWGNANTWGSFAASNPDYEVLPTPVVGSIATATGGQYGHVAYVTAVNGSTITVSEMNCCGGCNYGVRSWEYNATYFNSGYVVPRGTPLPTCGDGTCDTGESCSNCPDDCPCPVCATQVRTGETIIDDKDACFELKGTSSYWHSESIGYDNHMWWTRVSNTTVDNHAFWHLHVADSGDYEVQVFIPQNHGTTERAIYKIYHNGQHSDSPAVRQVDWYDDWVSLGTYTFRTGDDQYVLLEDVTGESNTSLEIGFDAIRLLTAQSCDPNVSRSCHNGNVHWFDSCGNLGDMDQSCDDGDFCTTDSCEGDSCRHNAVASCCTGDPQCDDGDPCTTDRCQSGACSHDAIPSCCISDGQCADASACTRDWCEANACRHEPLADCCSSGEDCNDGNPCTNDHCESNSCGYSAVVGCCTSEGQCNDGDPCTTDLCEANVCRHDDLPDCCERADQCNDGDVCTVDDCLGNACNHAPLPNCCHDDGDCDDGDEMTNDRCLNSVCQHDLAVECDSDGQCNDADSCTEDRCQGGWCSNQPILDCCRVDGNCNDMVECTVDLCLEGRCVYQATPSAYVACFSGNVFSFDSCGNAETMVLQCAPCACDVDHCQEPNCAGKACGDDGCGGNCGVCLAGESCVLGGCVPQGSCGALGPGGACSGNMLQQCVNGGLVETDCAALGQLCQWDNGVGTYACQGQGCVPLCDGRECGPDGCGGLCGPDCPVGEMCSLLGVCEADDVPVILPDVGYPPPLDIPDGGDPVTPTVASVDSGCACSMSHPGPSSDGWAGLLLLGLALLLGRRSRLHKRV